MITDVILLDLFNTFGMPTSTTVSIVFELLGAAVAMSVIKIIANDEQTLTDLGQYINSESALLIISGILLSVVIAFTVGGIVQYFTRLVFSFHYEHRMKYFGAIFGGVALTAITYFIFMKGLRGTPFYGDIKDFLVGQELMIIGISFLFWTILSQVYQSVFKQNLLVLVIIVGTFGLALAFAGNDLVNFIGVPMAALHSYEAWVSSGVAADAFTMGDLAKKVPTESGLLFLAGAIMVVTLWFSKKARSVTETEIGLARQGEGEEKFRPNYLSRLVVRSSVNISKVVNYFLPNTVVNKIDSQFQKPVIDLTKEKSYELPAFDMIRASVNLMMAGILISIATSLKLPLSTTYVTFMVAMGTSLADRAWDRESAVYRVAGVVNVIGGWFITAIIAFVASGLFAYLMYVGGGVVIVLLLLLVVFLLVRSFISHSKKEKKKKEVQQLRRAEIITINEVIKESSNHISEVVKRTNKLYSNVVVDLANHDLSKLARTGKHVRKLNNEIAELKSDVFYFIKKLDDESVEASRFYLLVLRYLQDISQSIEFISAASHNHVNNNHKNLKKSQITDLKEINSKLQLLFKKIEEDFQQQNFNNLGEILNKKQNILNHVSELINSQINRVRSDEASPKNSTLYFGILLETKDLTEAIMSIIQLFQEFHLFSKVNNTK
jgi:phosphate/sulfate permease